MIYFFISDFTHHDHDPPDQDLRKIISARTKAIFTIILIPPKTTMIFNYYTTIIGVNGSQKKTTNESKFYLLLFYFIFIMTLDTSTDIDDGANIGDYVNIDRIFHEMHYKKNKIISHKMGLNKN